MRLRVSAAAASAGMIASKAGFPANAGLPSTISTSMASSAPSTAIGTYPSHSTSHRGKVIRATYAEVSEHHRQSGTHARSEGILGRGRLRRHEVIVC